MARKRPKFCGACGKVSKDTPQQSPVNAYAGEAPMVKIRHATNARQMVLDEMRRG